MICSPPGEDYIHSDLKESYYAVRYINPKVNIGVYV